ncbi:MAG: hypothetical protein J0L61_06410 [Planctomycetes bacterium]|nr:hypothetical protein [Planctomycetota bacterium]
MNARLIAMTAGTILTTLGTAPAAEDQPAEAAAAPGPSLTIYNQNFAVVRESLAMTLGAGTTRVRFADTSAHLEPESVILRDATGKTTLRVLEQNYRADAASEGLLLKAFEGQTIDFQLPPSPADGAQRTVRGKIIRSGYVPHTEAFSRYGQRYAQRQMSMASGAGGTSQPLIEVDGRLQFSLPGVPLFPSLGDDSILRPTLDWVLSTDKPGPVKAELGYLTGGLSWRADYTAIAPEEAQPGASGPDEKISLVGWVTIDNQSGKSYRDASLALMAGDVSKIQPEDQYLGAPAALYDMRGESAGPPVTERSFDDLHLYTVARPTTLHDRETKQVEFIKAESVAAKRLYIYDGAAFDPSMRHWDPASVRSNKDYGTRSNPKVWIMREFMNSQANGLGVPLPKGAMRFYRQDTADNAGRLQFVGENTIDHTPKDELVRVYTGNAFDIVGERRQTNFESNTDRNWTRESFEIKVRNHKKEPAEVRVVEHLYRWNEWSIEKPSQDFKKLDSTTIEFRLTLPPDAEKTVTYTASYRW